MINCMALFGFFNNKKNENNNTFPFQSTLDTPDLSSEEVSNEFPDVEETNF